MTTLILPRGGGRDGPRSVVARSGLIGRALLYLVFGLLALDVAVGARGRDDTQGAIERVAGGGWGRALVVVLCVGLAALVAWKIVQAVTGDPIEGSETTDRMKYAVKALVHAGALVAAVTVLISNFDSDVGGPSGPSNESSSAKQQAAASAFEWPGGRILVIAVGVAVIAFALYEFVRHTVGASFMERIDDHEVSEGGARVVEVSGRIGYGALSLMTGLIGGFLVVAGARRSSQEVEGVAGAIQELGHSGWGTAALWLVAAGLLSFAAFSLVEAWLRRVA